MGLRSFEHRTEPRMLLKIKYITGHHELKPQVPLEPQVPLRT